MRTMKDYASVGFLLVGLFAGTAHADSIYYTLDQTNSSFLPDGMYDYADVTISDNPNGNDIDFVVQVLASGFTSAGASTSDKLTLKTFSFNFKDTLSVDVNNLVDFDPTNWSVKKTGANLGGGFGTFDFELAPDKNKTATLTLSFTIANVTGDLLADYAIGYTASSEAYFGAHISGYSISGEDSAKFATVVPVPAAVWLFGSGLLALVGFARRRS